MFISIIQLNLHFKVLLDITKLSLTSVPYGRTGL